MDKIPRDNEGQQQTDKSAFMAHVRACRQVKSTVNVWLHDVSIQCAVDAKS